MRVLLTGASSFTGHFLAGELAESGHHVTALCTMDHDQYKGTRLARIDRLKDRCQLVFGVRFDSGRLLDLIASDAPTHDLLCCHGAHVGDYKGKGFDVQAAVAQNTLNLDKTCKALANAGCENVLLTGSYFEYWKGGTAPSPYTQSKVLTRKAFDLSCSNHGLALGHFVIPNPFGPLEDDRPRLTSYLMAQWKDGKVATVQTPDYVRDNIHVRLLAKAYVRMAEDMLARNGNRTVRPSGYVVSNGDFAHMVARQTAQRTGLECKVELKEQTDRGEPATLRNDETVDCGAHGLAEQGLWDEFVSYHMDKGE